MFKNITHRENLVVLTTKCFKTSALLESIVYLLRIQFDCVLGILAGKLELRKPELAQSSENKKQLIIIALH